MDLFDLDDYFEDRNSLKHVVCPSLVVGSKTDQLFPIEQQQQMADGLKQAGLYQNLIFCINL